MAATSKTCHDGSGTCSLLSKKIKPSAARAYSARVRVYCRAEQMVNIVDSWPID